jgi:hypothetical protein
MGSQTFVKAVISTQEKLQQFVDGLAIEEQAVMASILGTSATDEVEGFMLSGQLAGSSVHTAKGTGNVGLGSSTVSFTTPFGQSTAAIDGNAFDDLLAKQAKLDVF